MGRYYLFAKGLSQAPSSPIPPMGDEYCVIGVKRRQNLPIL